MSTSIFDPKAKARAQRRGVGVRVPCAEECLYCEQPLDEQHEHDHAPIPVRHGGDRTYCVCIGCHDMKDRIPVERWPKEFGQPWMEIWPALTPIQRIIFMKMCAMFHDEIDGGPGAHLRSV
jgi:hypothetical protein